MTWLLTKTNPDFDLFVLFRVRFKQDFVLFRVRFIQDFVLFRVCFRQDSLYFFLHLFLNLQLSAISSNDIHFLKC
jgi:hypothetical protein